ncbi:hypothetical protein OIV83_000456 [Microbotryomycetes sp. JL201]|nr:hypothetical protein OIV83_000456 [Microbotryomycetes sp. JL201]
MLHHSEVAKHNTKDNLWLIVKLGNADYRAENARSGADEVVSVQQGEAYDLTEFAPEHPGGMAILMKYAGKEATAACDLISPHTRALKSAEYKADHLLSIETGICLDGHSTDEPIHPPGTLEQYLPKDKHLGPVDMTGMKAEVVEESQEEKERQERIKNKPPIDQCLSLYDIEAVAKSVLPTAAWAYCKCTTHSSGSDDEITMRENRGAYQRIWFRPRVLRDVTEVDTSTTILGIPTSMPIYMTATALGRLGHPDGEKCLTRAGASKNIIQMIPTLASCSFDEIMDEGKPGQNFFMQLYVNKDRAITEKIVRHAEERGVKGLFITVDAPQLGRREKDMRQKFADVGSNVQQGTSFDKSQGAARAISSFIDPGLSWKDLEWFKSITKMPLILKGVQCWEDAVLAAEAGCAGVVLSNHGGRQLDFARSGIEILAEVMPELRKRDLLKNGFEVYVDGGVRRAGDILKAIAMGATAVGLGRPLLYGYCAYGAEGVEHAIQILKDEMDMNLRLIGAPSIKDVTEEMVDTSALHNRIVEAVPDHLMRNNYEPLSGVAQGLGAKPRL